LKGKLTLYYERIGKKNYTFSVEEEVEKLAKMTPEEF
jgi:hypothetical protein